MVTITAKEGKYFFSSFASLFDKQSISLDEKALSVDSINYLLSAIHSDRLLASKDDVTILTSLQESLKNSFNSVNLEQYPTKLEIKDLISALTDGAPPTLDSFKEVSDSLNILTKTKAASDSITLGTHLNTIVTPGIYGISGNIMSTDGDLPLGYPRKSLISGISGTLIVSKTLSNFAVQILINNKSIFKRILNLTNSSVYEDWDYLLSPSSLSTNLALSAETNLNDWRTPGLFAANTPIVEAGTVSKNYPADIPRNTGMLMLVSTFNSFVYQCIITTRSSYTAVRQVDAAGNFTPWITFNGSSKEKTKVISFGSSSFSAMKSLITNMVSGLGGEYTSDSIGGQILETMQGHQGSNPIHIKFKSGFTDLNGVVSSVEVFQDIRYSTLSANNSFSVTLSNGLKGSLDLTNKTFKATNATEVYEVGDDLLYVDFGYSSYRASAVHLINIGKNNITPLSVTADNLVEGTKRMVDYIKERDNDKYIVAGHFVNRGSTAAQKELVLEVNSKLRRMYGAHYLDMQDYLMSSQIWIDTNLTPTEDDLLKQSLGQLPVSLSNDSGHMNTAANTQTVRRLKERLLSLGYF